MVALCMSSVARLTPASCLCASSARQGQREGSRAQLNPKLIHLHFLPNCFLPPRFFSSGEFNGKAPRISMGSGLAHYFRMYLCLARRRGQYPGPIKVNGNQWIQASPDLAGRACTATLWPNPAPFQFSLTAAVPSCCDAGAALPSHTGILGDVKQLEQILHLPAAAMQGARN